MVHVTVFLIGAAFADISVSDIGVPPPAGVNVNLRSNAVGMKTEVLPTTWAGVNSPLPFTTTVIGPLQIALTCPAFLALLGPAVAAGITTPAKTRQPTAMVKRLFIALPLPQSLGAASDRLAPTR